VPTNSRLGVFRAADAALLRAAAYPAGAFPASPDPRVLEGDPEASMGWLRSVWAIDEVAEALEHASPVLTDQIRAVCAGVVVDPREIRRAAVSVLRYLQRMGGRATPFGLLAGVGCVGFGDRAHQQWGSGHRAMARAGAGWLDALIKRLESIPDLLARLEVIANTTMSVRGDRLIVPYQAHVQKKGTGAVEVSLRYTAAVRAALGLAGASIRVEALIGELREQFPSAQPTAVAGMLTELVARHALISSLHAPSTTVDALGHLLRALDQAGAAELSDTAEVVKRLQEVHSGLEQQNELVSGDGRRLRRRLVEQMADVAEGGGQPLALDLRLDVSTTLPDAVAREIERATAVLTRLAAFPVGSPAWRPYHQRFYERYGLGALVPVLEMVSDSGIGWPDGYPGTVTPEPRSPASERDQALLALAQKAALDGLAEVELSDDMIEGLRLGPEALRPPSHLELGVRIHAPSQEELTRGRFRAEVVSVARAAGVQSGRFLSVLAAEDSARLAGNLVDLPGADDDTVAAQLSFAPLDPSTAHVTRTPRMLPMVISLGEHRPRGDDALTVDDLAVGCDGRRMYLAVPKLGLRVEVAGLHALNLRTHTPPLARLLIELSRAQCAQVMTFGWGLAGGLPYLPRLRYGRVIVAPARWRLEATEVPPGSVPFSVWADGLATWLARRRVPRWVYLSDGDRRLPLDLQVAGHCMLLRVHLQRAATAVLVEAPTPQDLGWCGGRAHEVVATVTSTVPPAWPVLPKPTRARVTGSDQGLAPAASNVLLACLYGDLLRQDVVLTQYLPELLRGLDQPEWWFVRYRDPDHHLRLRIALPDPAAFGPVAAEISAWCTKLNRLGLLREVRYPTSFPEYGRWGRGQAWSAAEDVFRADSRALLAQLSEPIRPPEQVLVAAQTVAVAAAFTGSTAAGMRWLIEHVSATPPARVPRTRYQQAVSLASPGDDWAALRAVDGGAAIVDAWQPRAQILAAYRACFPGVDTDGVSADDVLTSLIHSTFVRACGIDFDDEAIGMYLARAAAKAWAARTSGGTT
jgi:thiopeptide-type bacteriocin biosynthesis protein